MRTEDRKCGAKPSATTAEHSHLAPHTSLPQNGFPHPEKHLSLNKGNLTPGTSGQRSQPGIREPVAAAGVDGLQAAAAAQRSKCVVRELVAAADVDRAQRRARGRRAADGGVRQALAAGQVQSL